MQDRPEPSRNAFQRCVDRAFEKLGYFLALALRPGVRITTMAVLLCWMALNLYGLWADSRSWRNFLIGIGFLVFGAMMIAIHCWILERRQERK